MSQGYPQPPVPPPLPIRRSKARLVGAVIVVIILIGAVASYFLFIGPKISITDWSHAPTIQTSTLAGQVFTVSLKNTGILSGSVKVVCVVTYTSDSKAFNTTQEVKLAGGAQGTSSIVVVLNSPLRLIDNTATWEVHLG